MRKLAICGSYPENRDLIPWADEATEIWAFNEAPQKPWWKRWNAVFQIHPESVYTSSTNYVNSDHWQWLQQDHGDRVIWMQKADPRVPNSREYPLEAVMGMIGQKILTADGRYIPYRYIRSSIAAALGLALYLGYDDISLYGINLVSNTEYAYQAKNMAFWIGYALGRGINLNLMCWSTEFNQRLYGWDGELQIGRDFFEARIATLEGKAKETDYAYRRARDKVESGLTDNKFQDVAALIVELESLSMKAGEMAGALEEARRYLNHEGDIPRQRFEYTIAKSTTEGEGLRATTYHLGGICEYVWNVWSQTQRPEARQILREYIRKKAEMAWSTGKKLGMVRENELYVREIDTRVESAGGMRTLQALGIDVPVGTPAQAAG